MPELNTNYGVDLLGAVTKGVALRNLLTENAMNEQRLANMPEEMNYLKQSREQTLAKNKQAIAAGATSAENLKALQPVVRADAFKKYLADVAPNISWQTYANGGREHLLETAKGLGVEKTFEQGLPTPWQIINEAMAANQMPEQYYNAQRDKFTTSFKEQTERMKAEADTITAEARKTAAEKTAAPSLKNVIMYDKEGKAHTVDLNNPLSQKVITGLNLTEVKPGTTETWGPEKPGKGGTTVQVSSRGQIRTIYKPITEKEAKTGTWTYMGTDDEATGKPILLNSKTGEQRIGTLKVGAKPSAKKKSTIAEDLGLKSSATKYEITATNANGDKVGWDGTKWVPIK